MNILAGSHGIVYVRVSTLHQADDELPIESQMAELTAAVERAGATCEVVKDAGLSGTDYQGANVKRKQDHRDGVKRDHLDVEWTWVS